MNPVNYQIRPVRAEKLVHESDQQSCSPVTLPVMLTGHVPPVRLPPDHAASRVAAAVPAQGGVEDRRDLDPATPARGPAAATAAPPEPELGGPGPARGTARRDTGSSPTRIAADGHPGHDLALAPRYSPPPPGHQVHAGQDRPAGDPPEYQGPGPSARPREPRMGVPQDPRRAGRAGSQGRCIDRRGDPQGQRRRSCPATTGRSGLAAVPAFSGRGDPGAAFFTAGLPGGTQACVLAVTGHAARRIRILGVTLHPAGERAAQQARNLLMDLGGPAERMKFMIRDRGPDFTAASGAALAGAGIRTVPRNVRTPRMNAIAEHRIGGPPRAPGPHPRREPAPSAADPARVRDPPQPAPAAPLPARRRAAETAARTGRS